MQRLHAMDSARAALLPLGVLFHSMVFVYLYQPPKSAEEFLFIVFAHQFLHAFRMPAFFIIAGFFAAYLLAGRGAAGLIKNRLARIFAPLVIFWLPITFANSWTSQGSWISDRNTFDILPVDFQHLWFLYFLMIFSLILAAVPNRMLTAISKATRPAIVLVVVALATPLLPGVLDAEVTLATSSRLIPDPGLLAFYLILFLTGAIIFHQRDTWLVFLSDKAVPMSLVFLIAFTIFFFTQDTGAATVPFVYGLAVSLGSFGAIGIFLRFFSRSNKVTRFVSDSSYWMYLVHLPLVFFFLVSFARLELGALPTVLLTTVLTITISLVSYKLLVRSTLLGKLLNGKTRPFFRKSGS